MDFSVCDVILHSLGIYSRGCKSSHLLSHRPIYHASPSYEEYTRIIGHCGWEDNCTDNQPSHA